MAPARPPDGIDLARDRDLEGRAWRTSARRVLLALVAVLPALALLNVFGQRPSTSRAAGTGATLEVEAPAHLRGGLLFQGRFRVHAQQLIRQPRLVLDRGWVEGMQLNSVIPEAEAQTQRGGRVVFSFDPISPGEVLEVRMQFQVNGTNVGRRSQGVEFDDGTTPLASLRRKVTIFP